MWSAIDVDDSGEIQVEEFQKLFFDDEGAIVENADVTNADSPLSDLLLNDFWGTPMTSSRSHKSWRPLTVLTLRINHNVHGLDEMGYHAVNVALHGVASFLFVSVCDVFFLASSPSSLSVAAGLLFAVHPIHTEVSAPCAAYMAHIRPT